MTLEEMRKIKQERGYHLNYEGQLENGAVQMTTHAGYAGYASEIIIT